MRFAITADLHTGYNNKTYKILKDFFLKMRDVGEPDAIIIAGDIISHKQAQWKSAFNLIRGTFKEIPVLIVRGNHDWSPGQTGVAAAPLASADR